MAYLVKSPTSQQGPQVLVDVFFGHEAKPLPNGLSADIHDTHSLRALDDAAVGVDWTASDHTVCEEKNVYVSHSMVDETDFGVFTECGQPKGIWLFEFTGELKFVRDADLEEEEEKDRNPLLVWRVSQQDGLSLVVDATVCGNQARVCQTNHQRRTWRPSW